MGTLNPLEVLPLEVWKNIFEQLGGQQGCSTNLLNCSRVCTTFEDILMPTQSQWLFETIFPLIFPYLEGKEVLACRRVCKEWCRVVDRFLEDFEARRPFNKDTNCVSSTFLGQHLILRKKGLEWTHLKSEEDLTEFMKNMKNSKHPFIGGSLWLSDPYSSDPDPEMNNDKHPRLDAAAREDRKILFWKKVSEFLLMFGERVKYIKLTCYKSPPVNASIIELYQLLRQYLICLPNLRGLNLDGDFSCFEQDFTNSEENCRRLKEFLESDSSSLPEISSLESIEMRAMNLPLSICEKLIAGINPRKLRCLKLMNPLSSVEGTATTLNEPLPNLTELDLTCVKNVVHLHNLLTNLVSKDAPLGKLTLNFLLPACLATTTHFDLVCEVISKFGPTLHMLSIAGFGSHDKSTQLTVPTLRMLKIPHVRSLVLESHTFGPGPGFLPSNFAQSLEYLQILIACSDEDIVLSRRQGPGTEFYRDAINGELCNSTIWSKMPKLKGIKVCLRFFEKTITCTREMHERGIRCAPIKITVLDNPNFPTYRLD